MKTMNRVLSGLLGIALLVETSYAAGLPSEDPIVARIAEEFEQGTKPTEEDLKIKWTKCTEFMATRGNFKIFRNGVNGRDLLFAFEKFDGSYWKSVGHVGGYLTENSRELFGVVDREKRYIRTFRMSHAGAMISEWAVEIGEGRKIPQSEGGGSPALGEYAQKRSAVLASYSVCER